MLSIIQTESPKKLYLGIKDEKITLNEDCEYYVLPTNYKHLKIEINKTKNIDKLIITDEILNSCQEKQCSSESNLCQSKILEFKIF